MNTLSRGESEMISLRYMGAAVASIVLCLGWVAFAAAEKSDEKPPVMFVQSAAGAFKDGKLMLLSPSTTFMTGKMAGHMRCRNFIKAWSNGDDSFKKDPPKAVLSVLAPNGETKKMDVTLQNPRFDGPNLIYDASILKGNAPDGMYEAALFINDARLTNVYYQDVLPDGTVTGPLAPDAHGG
jgi:hypothetical protein